MAQWGTAQYGDGAPVPLKADRCTARMPNSLDQHPCKLHGEHEKEHKCICGARWVTENA